MTSTTSRGGEAAPDPADQERIIGSRHELHAEIENAVLVDLPTDQAEYWLPAHEGPQRGDLEPNGSIAAAGPDAGNRLRQSGEHATTEMTTSMQLLTFEHLLELAEQRRSKARSAESIAGWDRLLEVARGLAGSAENTDDFVNNRTWQLLRVRIDGYQGIGGQPLEIEFDPTPGVTVLHGPNGSGKSSIADAIETALHGAPRAPTAVGSGGRAPLWEREHCGRDAVQATAVVTVVDGNDKLVLSCRLNKAGQVVDRQAQRVVEGGTSSNIDLSSTTWHAALAGHRPVFGYAALERQVQLARNLQEFLEPLLAFGGCFEALRAAVEDAGTPSAIAKTRWEQALREARGAVDEVDRNRARTDASPLRDVVWPSIDDDPGAWLVGSDLMETGIAVPEVTAQHHDRLRLAAVRAVTALDDLERAETSLHARLAGPLGDLHSHASRLAEPGETCPVCRTGSVQWTSTLSATVTGLVATETQDAAFRSGLGMLRHSLDRDLSDIAAVLGQDWCATSVIEAAAETIDRCAELRQILDHDGHRATPALRAAVRAAHERLTCDEWRATVDEIALQSDHRSQWLRARRAAVEDFVKTWRETAADGAAAASWESAGNCLRSLQTQLRKTRTSGLQTVTNNAVQVLLRDVGLRIAGLTVQETKAAVDITDDSGGDVHLSMLSAGQRNALLLAPLLAVTRSGPFGFLVLDDPVHAFDQIRVDRLARLIHELADQRRVIVLTHDERLTEHLLAHSSTYDARSVHRDHTTGRVTEVRTHETWRVLLADARDVLTVAGKHPGGLTLGPTDLVRGLCRMAVDDALRRFVVKRAVSAGHDPGADLAVLDGKDIMTTKKRIGAAKGLHPADPTVATAEQCISPYWDDWNAAAHGKPAKSDAQLAEVDAAEQACSSLAGSP